jgi:hypothetical protein
MRLLDTVELDAEHEAHFRPLRELQEGWFSRYPEDHKADLRSRFVSKDPRQQVAAWWELYLHELFLRLGMLREVHPRLAGTSHRPDFLLETNGAPWLLEATVAGPANRDERQEALRRDLVETLNRATLPGFRVFVEADLEKPVPGRWIREQLEGWAREQKPDALVFRLKEMNGDALSREWRDDGWRVRVDLLPQPPQLRGFRMSTVAGSSRGARILDVNERIRGALDSKTGRYGHPPMPLVLAVLADGEFMKAADLDAALVGGIEVHRRPVSGGDGRQHTWVRKGRRTDGFWNQAGGPRHRSTSAVLYASNLGPFDYIGVVAGSLTLRHNPWAAHPLTARLPFSAFRYDERLDPIGDASHVVSPLQLLGLPATWPGGVQLKDYVRA